MGWVVCIVRTADSPPLAEDYFPSVKTKRGIETRVISMAHIRKYNVHDETFKF